MEVIDVIHQDTHGGSMRYIIGHKGERVISEDTMHECWPALLANHYFIFRAGRGAQL
jgi:hypothetical protein